jgi:hypothetical protein
MSSPEFRPALGQQVLVLVLDQTATSITTNGQRINADPSISSAGAGILTELSLHLKNADSPIFFSFVASTD